MKRVLDLAATFLPRPASVRRLALGSMITNVGNGAWYTCWAIFLTQQVGLSPATVGVGMAIASSVAMTVATPLGRLADRFGPRDVFASMQVLQAFGSFAFLLIDGFWSFLLVACITNTGVAAGGPRNALIVGLAGRDERMRSLAAFRTVGHLGWVVGASVGAVVLHVGTQRAFAALILLNGLTFLTYGVIARTVPCVIAAREAGARSRWVVCDRPYLLLAALMAALSLCWGMLSTGVPLWILRHTDASSALAAVLVMINSAIIAAFQIRVSRGVESPRQAARRGVVSGLALAASCCLFALTAGRGGGVAVMLLLSAGAAHVVGELFFVAASWGLSVSLMRAEAMAEYQGLFAAGEAGAQMLAPILMTTLVVNWGQPGWLVLAALFAAVSLAVTPATHRALATRPAGPQPPQMRRRAVAVDGLGDAGA
jgi:Major Facilitator Superfamily